MINIFNRKLLCQDSSAESAAKVWAALRQAKIPYTVKTNVAGAAKPSVKMANGGRMGSMASGASLGSSITQGVPQSQFDGGSTNYTYFIYVNKKDYDKAKELCDI